MPETSLPNPKENQSKHQPPILKSGVLLAFIALALVLKIIGLWWEQANPTLASDLTTENISVAINRERSLRNLVTLNYNSPLTIAAQSKTNDMQARHYFAHVDPDGHYIWDKIVANGYSPYLQLGENLAIDFFDTESVVSAWMNSPTHRANILQDGFRDQGMGLTFGEISQGQYHSAIANTFGVLLPIKKAATSPTPTPAPVAPKPTPTPKIIKPLEPIIKTPPAITNVTASPTPTPAIATTTRLPLVAVRGSETENSPSFATPNNHDQATTVPLATSSAVIGSLAVPSKNHINRWLSLGFGLGLLLFLLYDLSLSVGKDLGLLDKKVNNLFVLILSLIVVGLIYWL